MQDTLSRFHDTITGTRAIPCLEGGMEMNLSYIHNFITTHVSPFGWTLLVVRPFRHNSHYWQVYFETNRTVQTVCTEAGYPVPEARQAVRSL